MAEELGKIEKPEVSSFKKGRKLYFVPLIYGGQDQPEDYLVKFYKYWEQVARQIAELTSKLGEVNRVYHELVAFSGEAGLKAIQELSDKSHEIVRACLEKKAQLEAAEDNEILTEFMDWSRCLIIGLQNPKVISRIYDSYVEAGKKRNEYIARKIDETLQENEIGILLMRENHQVQFPADIQVFYVAPPALDEIKRWLREHQGRPEEEQPSPDS
jgi:Fe2+ transport system protein B